MRLDRALVRIAHGKNGQRCTFLGKPKTTTSFHLLVRPNDYIILLTTNHLLFTINLRAASCRLLKGGYRIISGTNERRLYQFHSFIHFHSGGHHDLGDF
jgi:hypothetical protein